jgi:hypothetical protein
MLAVKERAVDMINRMSDDQVVIVIEYLQNIDKQQEADDGSLAYLFRDYVDDGVREPLVNFGEAVGNERIFTV